MSDEWRDRVLKHCAKLERLFVASPKAQLASYTVRVGKIQDAAGGDKAPREDVLIRLSDELRVLTNKLRQERDGTVLRQELLADDPLCPTHGIPMEWKTIPRKISLFQATGQSHLFRCADETCQIVLWHGRFHALDEHGNLRPLPRTQPPPLIP
jgi:hypothetical protein